MLIRESTKIRNYKFFCGGISLAFLKFATPPGSGKNSKGSVVYLRDFKIAHYKCNG